MPAPSPHHLKTLYISGLTLRQIGDKVGRSYNTVWYHLRKLAGYHDMVTNILIRRVVSAEQAYDVTRAHAQKRRLKHTLAMLRQRRPALFALVIERSRPKVCPECSRTIAARLRANLWAWQCGYCGGGGFAKQDLAAALAAMQQSMKDASK